ncbi:hypothetical protein ACJX0J_028250, partial [Zea mays]
INSVSCYVFCFAYVYKTFATITFTQHGTAEEILDGSAGANIVDQIVNVTPAEDYIYILVSTISLFDFSDLLLITFILKNIKNLLERRTFQKKHEEEILQLKTKIISIYIYSSINTWEIYREFGDPGVYDMPIVHYNILTPHTCSNYYMYNAKKLCKPLNVRDGFIGVPS